MILRCFLQWLGSVDSCPPSFSCVTAILLEDDQKLMQPKMSTCAPHSVVRCSHFNSKVVVQICMKTMAAGFSWRIKRLTNCFEQVHKSTSLHVIYPLIYSVWQKWIISFVSVCVCMSVCVCEWVCSDEFLSFSTSYKYLFSKLGCFWMKISNRCHLQTKFNSLSA